MYVVFNVLVATLKKRKKEKKKDDIRFSKWSHLTQYIQNIPISTYNQYKNY